MLRYRFIEAANAKTLEALVNQYLKESEYVPEEEEEEEEEEAEDSNYPPRMVHENSPKKPEPSELCGLTYVTLEVRNLETRNYPYFAIMQFSDTEPGG